MAKKEKLDEIKNIVEKIEGVYQRRDALNKAKEREHELNTAILDKNEARTINRNGKAVEVTDRELFEEIRILQSLDSEAGQVFKEVHPDAYEAMVQTAETTAELEEYVQREFGFAFRHMSIGDLFQLIELVVDYKEEKKKELPSV